MNVTQYSAPELLAAGVKCVTIDMAKTNIRSFRYSDEVAGILEGFQGSSFNDKFEGFVLHCFWERKQIDAKLAQKRKEYDELCKKVQAKRAELYEFESLTAEKMRLSAAVAKISIDIIDYRDRQLKTMQDDVTQI